MCFCKKNQRVDIRFVARCVTYGEKIEEAKKMAKDAIELYLESLKTHTIFKV